MSTFCRQARTINIGSHVHTAGMLRTLLGQLMPLTSDIRAACDAPWSVNESSDSSAAASAATNEVLDSFRSELLNAVDTCVTAVKDKMRLFQKRVFRRTTPTKTNSPVPANSSHGSPRASPKMSPALLNFRAATPPPLLFSADIAVVHQSLKTHAPSPSSPHPPAAFVCTCRLLCCLTWLLQVKDLRLTFRGNFIRHRQRMQEQSPLWIPRRLQQQRRVHRHHRRRHHHQQL